MRFKLSRGIAASAALMLTVSTAHAAEGIKWVKTFADAKAQASKAHKLIMVDFFTEW